MAFNSDAVLLWANDAVATRFADWLTRGDGRERIAGYRIQGRSAFRVWPLGCPSTAPASLPCTEAPSSKQVWPFPFAASVGRLSPFLVPAKQGARVAQSQLPERERRTGARLFRRSTTVGHDRLARFPQLFGRLFD